MTERPAEPAVGQRLRDLRQRRGLTQRRLAQACDLSANAIGLIERGESSPSVSTLHRLALALEVPIAELFTESETQTVVLTKKSQRLQAHRGQIQMENLAEGLSDQCMEPYLLLCSRVLEPGPIRSSIWERSLFSAWRARSNTGSQTTLTNSRQETA